MKLVEVANVRSLGSRNFEYMESRIDNLSMEYC